MLHHECGARSVNSAVAAASFAVGNWCRASRSFPDFHDELFREQSKESFLPAKLPAQVFQTFSAHDDLPSISRKPRELATRFTDGPDARRVAKKPQSIDDPGRIHARVHVSAKERDTRGRRRNERTASGTNEFFLVAVRFFVIRTKGLSGRFFRLQPRNRAGLSLAKCMHLPRSAHENVWRLLLCCHNRATFHTSLRRYDDFARILRPF